MTLSQIHSYSENKDSSTVALKMFNERPEDNYPTFTFCIKSENGFIFSRDVEEMHLTRTQYGYHLRGGVTLNSTSDKYFQRSILNDYQLFSMKLVSILTQFDFTTKTGMESISYNENMTDKEVIGRAFYHSYRDPDRVCYTRKTESRNMIRSIRKEDSVHLDINNFIDSDEDSNILFSGTFDIFLHHPNQFIRSMDKPVFSISFNRSKSEMNENKKAVIDISIAFVSVLRKRPDANKRCNSSLTNDDEMFKKQIVNEIGCIPGYWKSLLNYHMPFQVCRSSPQLKRAYQFIINSTEIFSRYDPPCEEMQIPVNVNYDIPRGGIGEFTFFVSYLAEKYNEITNVRNLPLNTLWSNAGGFIGIFVGFSLVQLADTIENNWNGFRAAIYRILLKVTWIITMLYGYLCIGCK